MMRLVLAIVAATALCGCQHSGQQAIDPFWGRTTVPAPATGSIGAPIVTPGCPQPLQQPIVTQGTPVTSGGPQATTPPSLLPAPMSSSPSSPGTALPMPATPAPGGNGTPYGYGAPTVTAPPSGYTTPNAAPPSGYSNSGPSPLGNSGIPAGTMPPASTYPGPPAATYPGPPASPAAPSGMTPGGTLPPSGGAAPTSPSPGPSAPTGPTTTPAPAGSPPGGPGYIPPDGDFKYHGTQAPAGRGNWVTPNGVAAVPVSLDGATVSAPPGTTLENGPSIVRIPTGAGAGSAVIPVSAESPAAPAP